MISKLAETDHLVSRTMVTLMACYDVYDVQYPKLREGILQLMQDSLIQLMQRRECSNVQVNAIQSSGCETYVQDGVVLV